MPPITLDSRNFREHLTKEGIVVIDFWAPWCGPCRVFGPIFDTVSDRHPDITFGKVNTEDEQALAGALQIRSIPTLMIFRDQVLLYAQPGSMSDEQLEDLVQQAKTVDMDHVRAEIEKVEKEEAAAAAGNGSQGNGQQD